MFRDETGGFHSLLSKKKKNLKQIIKTKEIFAILTNPIVLHLLQMSYVRPPSPFKDGRKEKQLVKNKYLERNKISISCILQENIGSGKNKKKITF